jgi:hypothetical protein
MVRQGRNSTEPGWRSRFEVASHGRVRLRERETDVEAGRRIDRWTFRQIGP